MMTQIRDLMNMSHCFGWLTATSVDLDRVFDGFESLFRLIGSNKR